MIMLATKFYLNCTYSCNMCSIIICYSNEKYRWNFHSHRRIIKIKTMNRFEFSYIQTFSSILMALTTSMRFYVDKTNNWKVSFGCTSNRYAFCNFFSISLCHVVVLFKHSFIVRKNHKNNVLQLIFSGENSIALNEKKKTKMEIIMLLIQNSNCTQKQKW